MKNIRKTGIALTVVLGAALFAWKKYQNYQKAHSFEGVCEMAEEDMHEMVKDGVITGAISNHVFEILKKLKRPKQEVDAETLQLVAEENCEDFMENDE